MTKSILPLVAVVCHLAVFPHVAHAAPILAASAVALNQVLSSDTQVAGSANAAAALTGSGTEIWRGTSRAAYGNLGAFSEASATGTAQATATWSDAFTIVSASLAAGTLVSFNVSNSMSGTLDTNDGFSAASQAGVLGQEAALVQSWWEGFGLAGQQGFLSEAEVRYDIGYPTEIYTYTTNCILQGSCETVTRVQLQVGQTYLVTQALTTRVLLSGMAFGYAQANYSSTAHWFLDPDAPGYGYVTASGTNYGTPLDPVPSPVPEPASLVLLGAGLSAAAVKRRKHR